MTDQEKKLDIPYFCVIPYEVRADKSLPSECKIFFGELCVLAKKEGYCWATDQQLADMKEVSLSIIQKWLLALENKGHLCRITENKPTKVMNNKSSWKKKRKIYVGKVLRAKKKD